MGETEMMMDQLLQQIKSTREFNQYQNLLQRVKAQPDLYRRIGEYRRRSIAAQMRGGEEFIAENNNVQKEFADLQNNGLAGEFFASEHQYCSMIRRLNARFMEGVELDTTFLNE